MISRARAFPVLLLWLGLSASACAPDPAYTGPPPREARSVGFLFWNVENLFDPEDDLANEGDDEFLPAEGWTPQRYGRKLSRLEEILGELEPHLAALAEIENRRVLEDLIATRRLRSRRYQIAHIESSDPRGIDVALLYREPLRLAAGEGAITLHDLGRTRGILEVRLEIGEMPLTVYVNHWKSRSGGVEQTEPRRLAAARFLRQLVLAREPEDDLLILGDLNDDPYSRSVSDTLAAVRSRNAVLNFEKGRYLYNPTWRFLAEPDLGTLYFNRDWEWNLFDQCIVSKGLLLPEGLRFDETSLAIHAPDRMRDRFRRPLRFRKGRDDEWTEGYSDHFPIHGRLRW